jgi:type II secretory ATPase GspE/PulE/Tfp pilus assembly ATPase PilB-like protein
MKKSRRLMRLFGRKDSEPEETDSENEEDGFHVEFPFVDLSTVDLDRSIGELIPESICRKAEGVCVANPDEHRVILVVVDPIETFIYDLVEMATDHRFKATLVQGDPEMISLAREWVFKVPAARQQESWKEWLETKKFHSEDLEVGEKKDDDDVEVTGAAVEMADQIIKEGIASNVSDIHLEMFDDALIIRYRQDGELRVVNSIDDLKLARAITRRIMVMADMDITRDSIARGGRIGVTVGGVGYDLRVSILPVRAGESVVMRLLHKGAFRVTLETLGFDQRQLTRYRWMIQHPHGMVLACGPTGSGKSTTLYASLKSISRPNRKLLTIEDPIEYEMPGIIQVQVNQAPKEEDDQLTFSKALREFLRHDPDVILVGEIRDEETAKTCVQAALTGHLVFSTVHTNDAVGIVNRLKNMGVEPYLIASTLVGGVAQRLARRLCEHCAEPIEPTGPDLSLFARFGITDPKLKRPVGCEKCRRTGYSGRIGLYELLTVTDPVKELIETGATALKIAEQARKDGMLSLLQDGLSKAASGVVSVDEVRETCMMDLSVDEAEVFLEG